MDFVSRDRRGGGVIPAIILVSDKGRKNAKLLFLAVVLGVIGVSVNRWVMVLQVMAVPIMPFDQWALYLPSWQEVATTLLPVAYGVILIALSHRYLPVWPQERELNPIDAPSAPEAAVAEDIDEAAEAAPEGDLAPAQA